MSEEERERRERGGGIESKYKDARGKGQEARDDKHEAEDGEAQKLRHTDN